MKKNNFEKEFIFWAVAAQGSGISGGDKIFIELARRWSKTHDIRIIVCEDGLEMCKAQGIANEKIEFNVIKLGVWKKAGFLVSYCLRIVLAIWQAFFVRVSELKDTIVYSASEFWMDSIPCFILKLRYPRIKWIASWYQTAPNPINGFSEGSIGPRHRARAFIYWLVQIFPRLIITRFADYVFVNNENERRYFNKLNQEGRIFVMLGAINTGEIKKWIVKLNNQKKEYDAVFQGRFHAQKGILELIKIWKIVAKTKPTARLVMIGDGPLKKNVELRIKNLELSDNIILTGYLFDGEEKYQIFSQSKIVVHPSFFDSGGMASMEAMAFGLPCVSFDLSAYNSYYPKGMVKAKIGDLNSFAVKITKLLDDKKYYKTFSKQGKSFLEEKWSWDTRAVNALKFLTKNEK